MKSLNIFRQSEKEREKKKKKWQQSVSEDGKRRKTTLRMQ